MHVIRVGAVGYDRLVQQLHVETWAPEYGSSLDLDETLTESISVDERVEVAGPWAPRPGRDDAVERVAFVDGIRRIDARLTLEDAEGPVPGICGTYAVGAVEWDRAARHTELVEARVTRLGVFGAGKGAPIPSASPLLAYPTESVPDADPGALVQHFHGRMRRAEADLSEELAKQGTFVIADGPINDLSATEKVGYIKSHRVPYLSPANAPVLGRLDAAERTPLFLLGASGNYPRYSWYQRLTPRGSGHSWHALVRCELSSHLGLDEAVRLADRVTAVLPAVASQPHVDPRAPQNLVPIAALERTLRRRLGDAGYVHRELRAAVGRAQARSRSEVML